MYLAWVHTSRDEWALRLRGEAPWPDGNLKRRWSVEELGRSLGGRLDEARAWDERGRPTTEAARHQRAPAPAPAADRPLTMAERAAQMRRRPVVITLPPTSDVQ